MDAESIHVTVACSPAAREVWEAALTLPAGSTVRQALQASGIFERFPDLDPGQAGVGVWGRKATPQQALREHDRVEVYRPLRVDPKVARRERFSKQGSKTAGLFATRRPGAKPGY